MKRVIGICICTLLIATSISVVGQEKNNPLNNSSKWIRTYDYYDYDFGRSVQQTTDEGFIIVGTSHPYTDHSNVWLVKTDSQGNIMWDKKFGGEENDNGWSVKQTIDGGYIIAGMTDSFGIGKDNFWLIKTDSMGNMVWNKTFSHSDPYGTNVIQTVDNGYIITGFTGKPDVSDAILIKTDESGNLEWTSTYGSSNGDGAYSVTQTLDGGYIVSGFTSIDDINFDIWLFKTNSEGEQLWDKTYFTDNDGIAFSVKLTDDGGFIVTGAISPYYTGNLESFINGEDPLYGYSEINMLLFKTNSDGELIWYNEFGEDVESWGWDVHQTNDGGYIVIGNTVSFIREDSFLIKTDSEGDEIWSKTYGSKFTTDITQSGQQTKDGGYILAGYKLSGYNSDFLLIKTDSEGNVARNRVITNSFLMRLFELFPNAFPLLRQILL